jgi:hypothetical protein
VRLTLRTLLAYLDDTLSAHEIRDIGQKVAESDAAQELIARIKQVTRRRRITTPPATGPGAKFDPNSVADYLDNSLDDEQVKEVEETCLASDVHLAEIAASHQILTLVLGEPALVPPTSRQRMYGLVHGREAIPYRKPAPAVGQGTMVDDSVVEGEHDETMLLGLPLYRRHGWWQWALPLTAAVLLLALVSTLWFILHPLTQENPRAVQATNEGNRPAPAVPVEPVKDEPKNVATPPADEKKQEAPRPIEEPENPKKPADDKATAVPAVPMKPVEDSKPPAVAGPPKASVERRELARYVSLPEAKPNILVQRAAGKEQWTRVRPESKLFSADELVSLPGYRSEIRLESDVHLLLWGSVPEQLYLPLLESGAKLHVPANGIDADVTLSRGRIVLSNHKAAGPAVARVRFHSEVWDLTLQEPGTEVGLDLLGFYPIDVAYKTGEGPLAKLILVVLKGKAGLKIGYEEYSQLREAPGPSLFQWDSRGKGVIGPTHLEAAPPEWSMSAPAASQEQLQLRRDMNGALDELSGKLTDQAPVDVRLAEAEKNPNRPLTRTLAVRCLGAIDAVPNLLDALNNPDQADVRVTAIFALQHGLGRNAGQYKRLEEDLREKQYKPSEAETIMQFLHGFTAEQVAMPETYELLIYHLKNQRLPIRQLAHWRLLAMVPDGRKIPYDPAGDTEQRDRGHDKWKELIPDGKLPPKPMKK